MSHLGHRPQRLPTRGSLRWGALALALLPLLGCSTVPMPDEGQPKSVLAKPPELPLTWRVAPPQLELSDDEAPKGYQAHEVLDAQALATNLAGWLELNQLGTSAHSFERADCIAWLADDDGRRFDLIFLDPPTFSNSKSMEREFDVQRDHVQLIRGALARLAPSGKLVFSTNLQRFKLDAGALGKVQVEDWSAETLPRDFARRPRIRSVYA